MTDWDSLRYILAVAREGGLSGAARVLGVNHATVSRQLAKAEDTAGVRFFTRLASGLQPTEAGQVAIAHAEEVEARMVALDMALAARDETEEGELKVTIPPLLADNHFAQDLKTFKELHPAIDLQIVGATEVLNLHRREADVAIRVTQSPEESLWGRMMSSQRAGWFAAPSFIEQYKDVIEGRDTETHLPYIAFLAWAQTNPTALFADLPSCRVAMRTDDMITAMALARQGSHRAFPGGQRPAFGAGAGAEADRSYAALGLDPPGPAPCAAGDRIHALHRRAVHRAPGLLHGPGCQLCRHGHSPGWCEV